VNPRTKAPAAIVVALLIAAGCASYPDAETVRDRAEKMVASSYPGMPESLTRRAVQDRAQQICTKIAGAKLTQEEAGEVVKLSRESIRYPASGRLAGDWKEGARLAYAGQGGRIVGGKPEVAKENGALCSNCHLLDPSEVNAGNIGPSLAAYGAQRGHSEAVTKLTYERIYDAWTYSPCSNMPRLGTGGHLTPEQIAHVVAYLTDPQSPVNKK
jgi:L-cysteine S-thiosulfotransferase